MTEAGVKRKITIIVWRTLNRRCRIFKDEREVRGNKKKKNIIFTLLLLLLLCRRTRHEMSRWLFTFPPRLSANTKRTGPGARHSPRHGRRFSTREYFSSPLSDAYTQQLWPGPCREILKVNRARKPSPSSSGPSAAAAGRGRPRPVNDRRDAADVLLCYFMYYVYAQTKPVP